MPESDPPQKVSIIPRGQALGVTFNVPEEERYHHGTDYFKARLAYIMGGRAADRLVYNQPFSGHESDLKQGTRLARYMVTHWGMSDRLGPMSFRVGEEHVFLGKEIQEPRDFSEETAAAIDEEVKKLLTQADEQAYVSFSKPTATSWIAWSRNCWSRKNYKKKKSTGSSARNRYAQVKRRMTRSCRF